MKCGMAESDLRYDLPELSSKYSKYRPLPPKELTAQILAFHEQNGNLLDMAVDVGCGTGKSTYWLADHFARVLGIDPSPTQLKCVDRTYSNLEFRQGKAEDLSFLSNESVDLLTIAQALHFVDEDAFNQEVVRILKPGGTLAVHGYGFQSFNDRLVAGIWYQYMDKNIIPYFTGRTARYLLSKYEHVLLPFQATSRYDYTVQTESSLDDLIGFFESFGAYGKMMEKDPDSTALKELHSQLLSAYQKTHGNSDKNPTLSFSVPYYLLLARKE